MFSKLILAGLLAASVSVAHAKDSWEFDVVNNSSLVADGFRTQEDGKWSSNWLHKKIKPGETWTLDFGHSSGDCTVRTQVHFTDNTFFDYDVNYCDASNLYIYEHTIKYD